MGLIEKITRCRWPSVAGEVTPQLKRHWLYEAGMFNRGLMDMVFRVEEDGITGADFVDATIPESKFDADLQANVGLQSGAVTVRKFANGALSADATGRAKMANDFLTTAKLQDAAVTAAKLDSGITVFGAPVGGMGFFGGEVAPEYWLECNGAVLAIADYPALYAAIGTLWGAGGVGTFKVPDFRGYFVRGWNHGASGNPDPDYASRTGGDHVGSVQDSQFKGHTHTWPTIAANPQQFIGSDNAHPIVGGATRVLTSSSTGGQESRMLNKYAMVCIFAGV